jgi:outer membrane protein assembly factor BamB
LPGFGSSSPIVLGGKVFLTCYGGYGLTRTDPGNIENLQRHVLCVDAKTGKIVWDKVQKPEGREREYQSFITQHGYASSTPTTDGQSLYVFFGRAGVFAYNLDGDVLWKAGVGDGIHDWGSGASPILYRNLVIVNASVESKSLVALDKATGKEVWRVGGSSRSWSTPAIVDLPDGKQELVLSVQGKVLGFDPATGKKLWDCDGIPDYVCPSVVAHEGVVYVTAGRKPMSVAVRAGGSGDVTQTHRLWQITKGSKVPTPVYWEGRLYWVDQTGVATCVDAKSGEQVYSQRLEIRGAGDKVYASLVLGDGKLYCVTRQSGTIVLALGPEFKELARNDLGDESVANATPAIDNGRLLLRSDRFLYCIGK